MVLCWKTTQVRRWLGDCTPWRRKEKPRDGLGIEGAGDLENARVAVPQPAARDLRSELHTPTYSELGREKELQRRDTTSRFSFLGSLTTVPEPAASVGGRSSQASLSRVLRYVTKDTQQYLFPDDPKIEKFPEPITPTTPSSRKYSFRSSRALKKGGAETKLTISAPVYGEFQTLTLSLPPMTLSWPNQYEDFGSDRTVSDSEGEPSPTRSLPFTDCAETIKTFATEDARTIDYYNEGFTRQHLDAFDNRRKRLSCASQLSCISILSTDTGRISLAQVAMRPESRPTIQMIGPCESPRRVVVMHY